LITEQVKIISQTFPKNVNTRSSFGKDLWFVKGDATQIHQIILNLSVNARDAMPNGGTITLGAENAEVDEAFASMHQGATPGPHCIISVTDTGTGMPPEVLAKIFDPFFTTKEVGKGTGLGMATVLSIVRGHGGFIVVHSEVGHGTSFKIYLPAVKDAAEAHAVEEINTPPGKGERILVVDDEMTVRQTLIGTLEGHGYQVFSAEDGSDALALYFQWRDEISLIITDLNMGQMDGIAFIRSVRKINPVAKVLVSSGHLTKEACAVLNTLGVLAGIEKPFTAKTLLTQVHTALNGKR
jgi:CheY-like chemotaxis protein